MSDLVLGKRYIYNGYDCNLVGIDEGQLATGILLKFNCQHPYSGSPYSIYENLGYDIIKYEGVACPFTLDKGELSFLKPYEVKVIDTKLARVLYPHAKVDGEYLILED